MQNQAVELASGENGQPKMYGSEVLPGDTAHGIGIFEEVKVSQWEGYLGLLNGDLTVAK